METENSHSRNNDYLILGQNFDSSLFSCCTVVVRFCPGECQSRIYCTEIRETLPICPRSQISITLSVLKQMLLFKNIHHWFIVTNKMKYRFSLSKAAVSLELIKDTKKLNVTLVYSKCKNLANLQATAQGRVAFISRLFAYSRLSLYFQGLNKA